MLTLADLAEGSVDEYAAKDSSGRKRSELERQREALFEKIQNVDNHNFVRQSTRQNIPKATNMALTPGGAKVSFDHDGTSKKSKVTAEMGAAPYEAIDESHTTPSMYGKRREPLLTTDTKGKWKTVRRSLEVARALKGNHEPTPSNVVDLGHSHGPGRERGVSGGMELEVPLPPPNRLSPPTVHIAAPASPADSSDSATSSEAYLHPGTSPLSPHGGGGMNLSQSPLKYQGRTRFVEFKRLRALSEHALFEEVAQCPGISLDELEYHDLHAVSVAIVKYRFGASPAATSHKADVEKGMETSVAPGSPASRGGSYKDLGSTPVLPRQGTTLLEGVVSSGPAAELGPWSGDKALTSRGETRGSNERALSVAPPPGRGTAVFYAEDFPTKEEGGLVSQTRSAPKWNYGGAAARDAKNVVSKMVVGRESLPGADCAGGQRGGEEASQGGVKRRKSHWDTAIRAAKAEAATKYGEANTGIGSGTRAGGNRGRDGAGSTSTAYGGWLSDVHVAGAERDNRFRERILAERASVRERLREQQVQALKKGLYSQGVTPEDSPIPGRVVTGLTSTSKKVKLKPSLSASTGGAAAAKTMLKVGAPVSRKRDPVGRVASSKANRVPLDVRNAQRSKGVISDRGAVGLFT